MPKMVINRGGSFKKWPMTGEGFDKTVNVWVGYIGMDEFIGNETFSLGGNVREPTPTKPTKNMEKTLSDEKERGKFWAYNGGLVVVAKKVTKKSSGKKLELEIPNGYGLLNGGHTQMVLEKMVKSPGVGSPAPLIQLEILEGDFTDDEIADLAGARNTSKNAKPSSIYNKKGTFKRIKDRLESGFEAKIDWGKGGTSATHRIAIENLIHWGMMVEGSREIGPKSGKNKYLHAGVAKVQQDYVDNYIDNDGDDIICLISSDILKLRDNIKHRIFLKNNGKQFGKASLLTINQKKVLREAAKGKKITTMFTEKEYEYAIKDDGLIFTILSSFGVALIKVKSTKKIKWRMNPEIMMNDEDFREEIWDVLKDSIVSAKSVKEVKANQAVAFSLRVMIDNYIKKYKGNKDPVEYSYGSI